MKAKELREMSDEQMEFTAREAAESMFRMRVAAQTDKIEVPTLMRKNRRLIARIKTLQTERASSKNGAN